MRETSSRNVTAAAALWEPWKRLTCAVYQRRLGVGTGELQGVSRSREGTFPRFSEGRRFLHQRKLQAPSSDCSLLPVFRLLEQDMLISSHWDFSSP